MNKKINYDTYVGRGRPRKSDYIKVNVGEFRDFKTAKDRVRPKNPEHDTTMDYFFMGLGLVALATLLWFQEEIISFIW